MQNWRLLSGGGSQGRELQGALQRGVERDPTPLQASAESCSPLSEMLLQVHPQILGSLSWGDVQSESSRGARA